MHHHLLSIIFVCCKRVAVSQTTSDHENPIVKLRLGAVTGTTMTTRLGKQFDAFRGIPYAQPPVGPLRFKPPLDIEPWHGVLDATKNGAICPQQASRSPGVLQSEDCLFLNIYTRQLHGDCTNTSYSYAYSLKPVIVFIHPGGYLFGSSESVTGAGPQYIMDRDIVLVTLNYRLGALGFLSTGTCDSPGNYGLIDQATALRWVRDHIRNFGGNPNSVTLFGHSAGAMSVTLHMVSPMSKGLFHRVIVMSGSEVGQFDVPYNQAELAVRQAQIFNCSTDSMTEVVNCLREVNATALAESSGQLQGFADVCPPLLFMPVVEEHCCQEPFLTDQPKTLFLRGEFAKVHIMTGVTELEFLANARSILQTPENREQFNASFTKLNPVCTWYEQGTRRSVRASDVFRQTLPEDIENDNQTLKALEEIISDGFISFPVHRFVYLTCQHTKVYYYETVYRSRYTTNTSPPYGTVHGDDLLYIIAPQSQVPPTGRNDPDRINLERMIRLWSGFARRGQPNQPNDAYLKGLEWRPATRRNFEYLEIGERLVMKRHLNEARYARWSRLFPLPRY